MSLESAYWDAVIVGGGPAGAAAACHLTRAGKKVLLLEKEKHAHHKVCGEFLSFEAQIYLRELGVDALDLGATPLQCLRLINGKHTARARLPFSGLGLSRFVLDEHLLACAAACGAEIRRGHKVRRITPAGKRWRVEACGLKGIDVDSVFLATGKHDVSGLKRPRGHQSHLIGFKMHFTCSPRQRQALNRHIDIMMFDGGYAGLQVIEDGKANLCLLIDKDRFAEMGKDWNALLAYLVSASPYLRTFLDEATPRWDQPAAIASLPYGYVYAAAGRPDEGIYRLGDQFAVIPSFSGEGMSIALHTAKLAAVASLEAGRQAAIYHRRAREEILPQIRAASLLARAIASPAARSLGFAVCRTFPSLMTRMAERTRLRAFSRKTCQTNARHAAMPLHERAPRGDKPAE